MPVWYTMHKNKCGNNRASEEDREEKNKSGMEKRHKSARCAPGAGGIMKGLRCAGVSRILNADEQGED